MTVSQVVPIHQEQMISREAHEAIIQALEWEHRAQLGKLGMQVALYREALERAGVTPPDKDGQELLEIWRGAAAVISTASEFVHRLGSSKEMLAERWQ